MKFFSSFINFLNENNGVLTGLSTMFWGIYVYFTIKTFKEIKKQTDLESKAFVVISAHKDTTIPKDKSFLQFKDSYEKWKGILTRNLPDVNINETTLILKLANKGKSDIHEWSLKVFAQIDPDEYLTSECNISGEVVETVIESNGADHYMASGEDLCIPIAQLAVYPIIEFCWELNYTDVKGITEKTFGGDKSFTSTNAMANPLKS